MIDLYLWSPGAIYTKLTHSNIDTNILKPVTENSRHFAQLDFEKHRKVCSGYHYFMT